MAARRRKSRKAGGARRAARRSRAESTRKVPRRPARSSGRKRAKPAAKPKRRKAASSRPKTKRRPAAPSRRAVAERSAAPQRLVSGAPVEVGVVLHFYPRAAAAVVALSRPIHRGDTIHVRGQTTDFVQPVRELALEGSPVSEGAPPQQIGVRFEQRARVGDRVFRVSW